MFNKMPMPKNLPKDQLSADIIIKLFENPRLGDFNISNMSQQEKLDLLKQINKELGIKPFKTRNIGYVGE